jgi:hypothetical protein
MIRPIQSYRSLTFTGVMVFAALIVAVAVVPPAAADAPVASTFSETLGPIPNPCTGDPHVYDLQVTTFDHSDDPVANRIARWDGTTSDGFVSTAGVGKITVTNGAFTNTFTRVFRHSDGSAFTLQGVLVVNLNTGTLQVERFNARCLGAG